MRHEAEGHLLVNERLKRFVDAVYAELPNGVDYQTLWDSLHGLGGTIPTAKILTDTAHRIAGNIHNLQARRVVGPWSSQTQWEWVPMVVTRARRSRSPSGKKIGVVLTWKILAGTPAPLMTERFWTLPQCSFMARYFGFSRPPSQKAKLPPRYPYLAPEQFVTMRAYGLLNPHKSGGDIGPVFDKLKFPPSVLAFNKEQLKYRNRTGAEYECPRRFSLDTLCHLCHVGYEECRAACHARTYVTKDCPLCHTRAPFDPADSGPFCVNCVNKAVYAKTT